MTRIRLEYVHEYIRRGKPYYYFRRRGFKLVRLPGLPGSTEFMAAYERALAGLPKPIGADRTRPGTVNAAIVGYYQCLAFRELASSTQYKRRTILERFRFDHGDKRIATLPQEFIARLLNQMKAGEARNWLKALRHLLDFAVAEKFRADNPARGFKLPKMKGGHRRAWTDLEVEQYERIHRIGSKARLAFALGLFTVQRAGDVTRMGRQHIRNGELTRPYRGTGFSQQFRTWCDEAGLPKDCCFHGLRATGCTKLADAGCSTHEVAAWSGHKTLKEVERYTSSANQKRLARSARSKTKTFSG